MKEENTSPVSELPDTSTYTSLLQRTYEEALTRNELNANYWIKIKEDYKTLQSHLEVLPDDVSKDVMVPVGPKALMKGKMVHTNEILVCLGDGWFIKQSAKQAAEICKRRIKMCDEMLEKLENERSLLTSRKELPFAKDAFGNAEGKEILEPYDEEVETHWRVQHREKEREYRKKLATLRNKEKIELKTEEDLWKKLDDLELQEELEEELDRLHVDDSEEDDYEEQESSDESENEAAIADSHVIELKSNENFLISSKLNNYLVADAYTSTKNNHGNGESLKSVTRRVSFKSDHIVEHHSQSDSEAEDPIRIEFKHSSCIPKEVNKENTETVIESPAAVYDQYVKNCIQSSAPKSILKRKSSSSDINNKVTWDNDSYPLHEENDICSMTETGMKHEWPVAVQMNVIEHDCNADSVTDSHVQTTRPISKFRAARTRKS